MTPETKAKFLDAMSTSWAWLREQAQAYPRTVQIVGGFLLGLVIGKLL